MSERWTNTLRPFTTGNLFDQGQAFKEYLKEAFEMGKEVLVSEMTNDGSVYCILNLLASGEVISSLLPPFFLTPVDLDCA